MAAAPKTPSLLPELRTLAENLNTISYEALLAAARDAGWSYFIQQTDAIGQTDGTVLVTFQVFVGKEDRFEPYDLLSVKVAPGPGPVSAVARRIAAESLVPLFFGRYPQAVPAAPQQPVTQTVRTDDVLPGDGVDEQEYVEEDGSQIGHSVDVIDHHEPDGVPIFSDLYSMDLPGLDRWPESQRTAAVIQAVLDEVDDFLQRAASVETINAMGTKNPMMIKFVKDLGTEKDSAELMDMITRRRNMVAPPVLSNARRRVSAEKAN